MDIITALDAGLVVRGGPSDDIYSETVDGSDRTPLAWTPPDDHPLQGWLARGNRFWAVKGGQVRLTLIGHEPVRVPKDLLQAVKEDGGTRFWEQGGYTFAVTQHEDQIKTALIGMPEGGNAVEAWTQEVNRVGIGNTFEDAVADAFDIDDWES